MTYDGLNVVNKDRHGEQTDGFQKNDGSGGVGVSGTKKKMMPRSCLCRSDIREIYPHWDLNPHHQEILDFLFPLTY